MLFSIALEYIVKIALESNTGIKIERNIEVTMVAYADDIMVVAESEANLKTITSVLIGKSKDMGLLSMKVKQST